MDEFRSIISGVSNETLDAFLAIYTDLLTQVPSGSPAYQSFLSMAECIKNEMSNRGMNIGGSYVSESDKKRAMNYLASHGISIKDNKPVVQEKNGFFEGFLGFVGFIGVIIVIAIIKGLFDVVVNLWNSGVLKVILGLGITGGGVYLGYKKGLFEKIENKINEFKQKRNSKKNKNSESNTKEKTKEIAKEAGAFAKEVVKDLVIGSSAAVVLGIGAAHVDKHTNILDNTFLEGYGDDCRFVYEYAGRFAREKVYELFNDYSEFENNGYMNYLDPNYSVNNRNWDYDDGDIYLHISHDRTWEWLSSYCYGNSNFSKHLRLYNSRYDFSDNIVHEGEIIFVPSPEKLEDYIYEKRLIKKR